ncbi:hypothetical protein BLA29_014167 [Euroglyphus maynei]|uniref:Uncharacterized protein n=1 Tax=Euroglyphus maynei TaxID=6958 RepID=A0A1Y3BL99_EURMA|nr:hypothetical protein BLA29_014167 [Euroglyphus maynei]
MDICCTNGSGTGDSSTICNESNSNICSAYNSTNTLFIGKCRNVRLRRTDPNQSLGFSIRGGKFCLYL